MVACRLSSKTYLLLKAASNNHVTVEVQKSNTLQYLTKVLIACQLATSDSLVSSDLPLYAGIYHMILYTILQKLAFWEI